MINKTIDGASRLTDGSEWIDHEDCIVGNEAGLRNLAAACEKAIEDGEYYGKDLGDYVGVKKLDTEWFERPEDAPTTRFANSILGVVLLLLFGLILVGIYATVSWIF